MAVMHPRLLVSVPGAVDAQGHLAVPKTDPIWTVRFPMKVGDYDAYEYRNASDDLFIVAKIAAVATRVLAVLFVPVPKDQDDVADLRGLRTALAPVVAKSWAIPAVESANPAIRHRERLSLEALEADNTALATTIKSALPARWRRLLPGDFVLDAAGKPVPTAPTGDRILGATIL